MNILRGTLGMERDGKNIEIERPVTTLLKQTKQKRTYI